MTPMTAERALFARHVHAALGPRVRITKDAEGWPLAPGRMGRLEWRGAEWDSGEHRLYCYMPRRRMIAKLRAVPGVHPAQLGAEEAAFWIGAGDAQAVRAVAVLLRLRQRRATAGVPLPPEQARALAARLSKHRATSGAEKASARVSPFLPLKSR
jgi:hypothetical protein